jgi:hypothetical protein
MLGNYRVAAQLASRVVLSSTELVSYLAQSVQGLVSSSMTGSHSSSPGRVVSSRPALGPTQPPVHSVPGVLSRWVKRQGRGSDHSPPTSAKVS